LPTKFKLDSPDHLYRLRVHNIYFCKLFSVSGVFQFNSFMAVIKDMLSRMESEHKTKLEQLHIRFGPSSCIYVTNNDCKTHT